jgi:CHAT domain-containing protein/tetratricopeptide (TPR) repeat protein
VYGGESDRGMRSMLRIRSAAPADAPALAARATWMVGTTHLRLGDYETARNEFLEASSLVARCGEQEYAGVTQAIAADAEYKLGDVTRAYETTARALRKLRPNHGSVWVHNVLAVTAEAVRIDGLKRTALRIQSEGLEAAREFGQPVYVAEALLARARVRGREAGPAALRDVDEASAIIEGMDSGFARTWLSADAAVTRSNASLPEARPRLTRELGQAIATFRKLQHRNRLVPALLARADAWLDAGDHEAARQDLAEAADLLSDEHDAIATASLRVSMLAGAQEVFSRAVSLAVAAGDTLGSLMLLERSRASLAPATIRGRSRLLRNPEIRPGRVVIEYLARTDTLFTWLMRGSDLNLTVRSLNGYAIADSVSRALSLLESSASPAGTDSMLASLHDRLIEPIRNEISAGDRILFVGNDWVAATPFAALRDRRSGRYLVEDHVVSIGATLAAGSSPERVARVPGVTLVANPAFDRRTHPSLDPLPASIVEVDSIRALLGRGEVVAGTAADVDAVARSLQTAGVFHFAGHAVVDSRRPLSSYLVLASDAKTATTGALTAADIQKIRMPGLELVVLSACETVRPAVGSNFSMNGLALGFLAAGAKGIVGSLWRVDDESARTLMVAFHKAFDASGDAAAALREAQLEMIAPSRRRSRNPADWSGFQYLTH